MTRGVWNRKIVRCVECTVRLLPKDYKYRCHCGKQHSLIGSDGVHCANCLGEPNYIPAQGADIIKPYRWEVLADE